MAAGKHRDYRDNQYWHRETDFRMPKKENGHGKRDYERVTNGVEEYERRQVQARRREYMGRFRKRRNFKEREVMNGGYRSTCIRSDSGSRRCKVAVGAMDAAIDSATQANRETEVKKMENNANQLCRKRKFSPIVWDRDDREVRRSIKSRGFSSSSSCSPSPGLIKYYRQSPNPDEDLQASAIEDGEISSEADLREEGQLVENTGKGGVDEDDYVPARSLISCRWANDAASAADEGEISELGEVRGCGRPISPEVGEVKREGAEGSGGRCLQSDIRGRSSSADSYSVNQCEVESKDDPRSLGAPEPTRALWDVDMLRGCRSVDEFERLNKIGEGTYGIVYRARDKKTGEIVALKKIKMMNEREGIPLTSRREINILLCLHHPSIVALKEVVRGSNLDSVYMVMEYMEHELRALMETMKQPFSQSEVKCLMLQLLEGVKCLHENRVLHRDLKTSNLLFNNRGELRICDFGLARKYENPLTPYTQRVVTLWYRAPELLLGTKEYSTAIDMWSVGCIMAELLSKEPLFDGKTELDQLDKIFRILGTPNERIWPGFSRLPGVKANFFKHKYNQLRRKFPAMSFTAGPVLSAAGFDLLNKLLTYDPEKRITAEEALNHEWFREVPLPKSKEFMPTFPVHHAQERYFGMQRVMKRLSPWKCNRERSYNKENCEQAPFDVLGGQVLLGLASGIILWLTFLLGLCNPVVILLAWKAVA